MMGRKGVKAGAVLETILILAGLGLIAKAVMAGMETYRFVNSADAQALDGLVTGVRNHGFSLNVQVTPATGGVIAFAQDGLVFGIKTDDHVPVLYNLNDPGGTRVDRFGTLWWKSMLFGLFGVVLFVMSVRLRAMRNL